MTLHAQLFSLLSLLAALPVVVLSQTFSFDADTLGSPPKGFSTALTGGGKPGQWVVMRDQSAPSGPNVLAQIDMDNTDNRFPLCILDNSNAKDVDISVKFKPLKGTVDQAGGLVWRYRDNKNYYLVRANALEDNFRIYHVLNGKRRQFGSANVKVQSNEWHTIRVRNMGDRFEAFFDGKKLLEASDTTFAGAGKIGLWTKADSYTHFDDLVIQGKK